MAGDEISAAGFFIGIDADAVAIGLMSSRDLAGAPIRALFEVFGAAADVDGACDGGGRQEGEGEGDDGLHG